MLYYNLKYKVYENYNINLFIKEYFIFYILIVILVIFCMCNYVFMYILSENFYNSYLNLINKKISYFYD